MEIVEIRTPRPHDAGEPNDRDRARSEHAEATKQVLDLYQKPYDPDCPVVCMDEQPVQLVKETRAPMAATKNRPRRVDYEYERAGTASIFLFSEPLAGWRQATARARRTKVDWALEVAGLLEGRYADCEKITLVCDNLNTHTKGAFYKVFEPTRARQLVRRIEFCYTPKHGSWRAHSRFPGHALTPTGVMAIRCKQFSIALIAPSPSSQGNGGEQRLDERRCGWRVAAETRSAGLRSRA